MGRPLIVVENPPKFMLATLSHEIEWSCKYNLLESNFGCIIDLNGWKESKSIIEKPDNIFGWGCTSKSDYRYKRNDLTN